MIPIKLTIEGIYSYQEKQVIDFTSLIEAGLFGIFGRVGSGKSSILEAISFGLYGESERLNARDNRAYNMMNLKSSRSLIDFEFYNFKDEKYRIYREFKRNSKRFEDVKRGEAILYQWKDEEWVPLPDLDIEGIVGLSYENFKRTIIIPQGQFKEFLELGGADRTRMMQQIFGLDRFDLANKTKSLLSSTRERLNLIEGELNSFSQVTAEEIGSKKELHLQESKKATELTVVYKQEQESYLKLKGLKEDFDVLAQKKSEFVQLEKRLPEILEQKKELVQYELFDKVFSALLVEQKNTNTKVVTKETRLEDATKEVIVLEGQFNKVAQELKGVEEQYAGLENVKAELYELNLIKEIQQADRVKQVLLERFQKGKSYVIEAEKSLEVSREKVKGLEVTLNQLKEKRIDTTILMAIDAWFNQHTLISTSIEGVQQTMQTLNEDIQAVDKDIQRLKLRDVNQWEQEIEQYRNQFEQEVGRIEGELRNHRVAQQLAQYASELHPGQPCPLCGSAHHPHILQGGDVSVAIQQSEKHLAEVKDKQQRLVKYERKATGLFDRKKMLLSQWTDSQQKELAYKQQLEIHQENFEWTLIVQANEEQFLLLKQQVEKDNQQIELLEKQYNSFLNEVEHYRGQVDKFSKELNLIEVEGVGLDGEIKSKRAQVVRLQIEAYLRMETPLIDQEVVRREERVAYIEQQYKDLTSQYQMLSPKLASVQTEVKNIQQELAELKEIVRQLEVKLGELLLANGLESIEEVVTVLNRQLNVLDSREQIQAFEVQFEVVKNSVYTLEEKLKGLSFDQELFAKQQDKIVLLEQQVKEATEVVAKLAGDIERLDRDFAKKQELQKQFEAFDKRLKNISVLKNMFDSAGFVNYVSSIYLRNLCDMANQRFHRLTNNQLSLQLNENNDFEIIDYLNEGKSRSVKTLSGGQSFQVSLSLALALAESVQSLSKSNKNFFFIDEGFGTQDTESVNIVFETLSNLHKENRIVGIISHVDELQERMPISLSIVKDEEKGSIIETNN